MIKYTTVAELIAELQKYDSESCIAISIGKVQTALNIRVEELPSGSSRTVLIYASEK